MGVVLNIFLILYIFNLFDTSHVTEDFHLQKDYHQPKILSNKQLIQLAQLTDMTRFEKILSKILVPRVVGTELHKKVREFIISELKGLGWTVETQVSVQTAPRFGDLTFTNVIGRLNPSADRYLVLACHYDSKHMGREHEFLGATDSAVPCAMMIDLAYALKDRLEKFKQKNLSLMMVFFDGEEAFVDWSDTDSVYGARSLASNWEQTPYPHPQSQTNRLHQMDLLVLLDLLGTPDPTFYSYFKTTERWYLAMASAEKRLTDLNQLNKLNNHVYFLKVHLPASIEDDHIPFLRRGVACLHIIPTPFPKVWHKHTDNYSCLDMNTIDNLNKIFRVFTLEYLEGELQDTRSADL